MVITGLTRNQVIPNGTEGSNPSLSAKNKGYSVCYTLYFFVDKTARDSNPYNLLQDEVLSKEAICREYPDRFKIIPSETNFIYVETPEAEKIFTYLKEAGIIIRKMSSDRLRITAGRNYENDAVASEINASLKGEPHENVVY